MRVIGREKREEKKKKKRKKWGGSFRKSIGGKGVFYLQSKPPILLFYS